MGDHASSIDNLPNNISKEDMDLVNSILSDISTDKGTSQQSVGQPVVSQEISKAEIMEKQKILEQAQQQNNLPNIQENNANMPTPYINSMEKNSIDNIIDMVKYESKNILLVIVLAFVFNLEQSNSILSYYSGAFLEGTTTLSTQGIIIKSLIIGLVYFVIKSQFL